MYTANSRRKLDKLLKQLYSKKQWLDTMITGLESATRSADHRLIESVTQIIAQSSQHKPTVDLDHQQKLRLARLASQVLAPAPRAGEAKPQRSSSVRRS